MILVFLFSKILINEVENSVFMRCLTVSIKSVHWSQMVPFPSPHHPLSNPCRSPMAITTVTSNHNPNSPGRLSAACGTPLRRWWGIPTCCRPWWRTPPSRHRRQDSHPCRRCRRTPWWWAPSPLSPASRREVPVAPALLFVYPFSSEETPDLFLPAGFIYKLALLPAALLPFYFPLSIALFLRNF